MFRISVIVCASLIFGITAKPWTKLSDEAFRDTVMSIDDKGKMSWGMEVESPEDMAGIQLDIDPSMKIWKSMTGSGQDKRHLKAEEDLDDLNHPSMADLLHVQMQNLDVLSAADIPVPQSQGNAGMKRNQEAEPDKDDVDHPVFRQVAPEEPEQDWDDVYHKAKELSGNLVPLVAEYQANAKVRVMPNEPEKDEDYLYHHDNQHSPVQMELQRHEMIGESQVRVHLQPEEDMDDLYHKDLLVPVLYKDDTKSDAPVDLPSQRKYSEPEEDLDDLYHQ